MCDVKSTGSFGAEKTAGVQTSKHEVDVVSDQRKCKQSSTRSTLCVTKGKQIAATRRLQVKDRLMLENPSMDPPW